MESRLCLYTRSAARCASPRPITKLRGQVSDVSPKTGIAVNKLYILLAFVTTPCLAIKGHGRLHDLPLKRPPSEPSGKNAVYAEGASSQSNSSRCASELDEASVNPPFDDSELSKPSTS